MLPRIFYQPSCHHRVFGLIPSIVQQTMANAHSGALAQASNHETVERPAKRAKLASHSDIGSYVKPFHFYYLSYHLAEPSTKRTRKSKTEEVDKAALPARKQSLWSVGAHVSSAGGVENAVVNAAKIGYVL